MKVFPLKKRVVGITSDSESFHNVDFTVETEIPQGNHVGAFAYRRKHHTHEGVDLYCQDGDAVYAMEDGEVVLVQWFTGPKAGLEWWEDTRAILIEGESGVICYGELIELSHIVNGYKVKAGEMIGNVKRVLSVDKGRPMSMLHVELHKHGTRRTTCWDPPDMPQPESMLDPTDLLISAKDNIPA